MSIGEERLKRVLGVDKKQNPEKMVKIIKSEVFCLLKDYFEFDGDEYNIGLESKDEQTALTEEQDELGNSGFLKYTDKAGFTTIFFAR